MSYPTLPHDVSIEQAVLGAMLLDNSSIEAVIIVLKESSDFYKLENQIIYSAILEMYGKIEKIDQLTILAWLRKGGLDKQAGGAIYIMDLTGKVSSSAHIDAHIRILSEYSIGRKLINLSQQLLITNNKKPDYLLMLEDLSKEIYKIEGSYFTKDIKTIFALSKEVMEEVQQCANKKDGITGEVTGIEVIDNYTGGLGRQDLVILAARPGMGKSSLAHSIIHQRAVTHNKATALFTLEMSSLQVTKVLHSHQTGIDHDKLKTGKLEDHEWTKYHATINPLLQSGIYIDDTPSMSISEIRAKSRRLVARNDVTMIIVDYLQLATVSLDKNKRSMIREQEISEISRGLKALAKELNVPVIALAQLSREAEKRANKIPILSDLRESGSIEQDADQVWFLFRPAYYKMEEDEHGNRIPKHLTKLIIAKYRQGDLAELDLRFIGRLKMLDSMPEFDDKSDELPAIKNVGFSEATINTFDDDPF